MTCIRLGICMPMFNEAQSIGETLRELAAVVAEQENVAELHVVLADDASRDDSASVAQNLWQGLTSEKRSMVLHIVTLTQNQGHQRALLCALRYAATLPIDACLIMDADGQDDPHALGPMVQAFAEAEVVFARRSRRAEGWLWILAYKSYQAIFRILLGKSLYFGNFCLISAEIARLIARQGDLGHLAATLNALPYAQSTVAVDRRRRRRGESKMNYSQLLDYAVAAMTASSHVWIRLFSRLSLLMAVASALGILSVVVIRLCTDLAISGWASIMSMLAFIISFQSLGFLVIISAMRQLTYQLAPVQIPHKDEVAQFNMGESADLTSQRAA